MDIIISTLMFLALFTFVGIISYKQYKWDKEMRQEIVKRIKRRSIAKAKDNGLC